MSLDRSVGGRGEGGRVELGCIAKSGRLQYDSRHNDWVTADQQNIYYIDKQSLILFLN